METLSAGDLTIEVLGQATDGSSPTDPETPLTLVWRGKSDDRYPGKVLGPYFARALDHAAARHAAIEMHFEKLDHFNSSTIAAVIRFIQDARQRGVRLVLVYNQQLKWQKLSFDALRVFARDELLELRATGRAALEAP